MGFWSAAESLGAKASKGLETVMQESNAPLNRVWSGAKSAGLDAFTRSGGLKSSRFAIQAGVAGAAGGAAGYYNSDGDTGGTLKGFGLGVLGAAAWNVSGSSAVRSVASDGWGAAKGWASKGKSWADKGMDKASNYVRQQASAERMATAANKSPLG
jgi:hypothetical protein